MSEAAVIVPASGHAPSVVDFRQDLDSRGVAKFKFPERAVATDGLPRHDVGEVLKDRLRAAIIADSEKV